MLRYLFPALLAFTGIAVAAGNEDLDIDKVNGSIHVPDNATVGKLSTVNGGIRIGAGAHAKSAETVNGGLRGSEKVKIARTVETVNGSITLDNGVDVGGKLSNVNGGIRLDNAHVGGGIDTVSGDIEVGENSRVEGGIVVEADHSWFRVGSGHLPRIVIGPHATVQGSLVFKREVELYVSDSATIGNVAGAKPIKFSGDRPTQIAK